MDSNITSRLDDILVRIASALDRAKRPRSSVRLVAVTKKQSINAMLQYQARALELGLPLIWGESYVQELKKKKAQSMFTGVFHLIGALQRNKVRDAVKLCDVIEAVDSMELALEISKEAAKIGKCQNIFIEVNVSRDPAKRGFLPEVLDEAFLSTLIAMPAIRLTGLMTITKHYEQVQDVRPDYSSMRVLLNHMGGILEKNGYTLEAPLELSPLELSMGMSEDFEIAVEEGASLVRIGTALFGER